MSSGAWTGVPLHRCARCETEYHVSELRWQRGILICQPCWDDPIAWERESIIREKLSDSTEEPRVAPILRNPDSFNYDI